MEADFKETQRSHNDIVAYKWQHKTAVWIFTARRYASVVYTVVVCLSVCVSVCVTLQYCNKTAKHRMTQIMPHNSPGTRFLTPKITAKFERVTPHRVTNAGGVG